MNMNQLKYVLTVANSSSFTGSGNETVYFTAGAFFEHQRTGK